MVEPDNRLKYILTKKIDLNILLFKIYIYKLILYQSNDITNKRYGNSTRRNYLMYITSVQCSIFNNIENRMSKV